MFFVAPKLFVGNLCLVLVLLFIALCPQGSHMLEKYLNLEGFF